eukprot:10832102-Ditylum_brightwellii.AAC.1
MDDCWFPAASKMVSREATIAHGAKMLCGEELHQMVTTVWEDNKNLPTVARSYVQHHQNVCAILDHDGDNNYLKEQKGMHFGICQCFVTTAEGGGVVAVELPPSEEETVSFQVAADRASCSLKYCIPNALEFDNVKLKDRQIDFLFQRMDPDEMTDEMWAL